MTTTTKNVDPQSTAAKLSNELRDEELEHVLGGTITRKIDASSPKLFETCCSGTPFKG
jgi:type VI protein secretion system component Hcp